MLLCIVVCRYVYSLEYGRTVNTSLAHDDAVSQLSMHGNLLVSSSCDSTVKVKIFNFIGNRCLQSQDVKLTIALVLLLFLLKLVLSFLCTSAALIVQLNLKLFDHSVQYNISFR